jgi:hypothetical protein
MPEAELLKLNEQTKIPDSLQTSRSNDDYGDLEEGWKMTDNMVQSMKDSAWLLDELADTGLQHLISKITSASSVVAVGDKRRHRRGAAPLMNIDTTTEREQLLAELTSNNPQFKRFIDKLLVMTGVLERHGGDNSLEQWLASNSNDTSDTLILKPLPRRARPGNDAVVPNASRSSDDGDDSSSEGNSVSSNEE